MKIRTITLLTSLFLILATAQSQSYPEMVTVQGGTFTMGDKLGLGDRDEQPTHQVTLSTYQISKTEVTVSQYRKFCTEVGYAMPDEPGWGWHDNHPIVNVSWQDAMFYCEWLTETTGASYNLPTEAQWEFAARGGTKSRDYKFSGSNSILFVGWFADSSGGKTHPVATKKPNELGIYDMSGNVWEWCLDWYDADYYSVSPVKNPKNITKGERTSRVLRGGSWYGSATFCRVSFRGSLKPTARRNFNGFRVVSF